MTFRQLQWPLIITVLLQYMYDVESVTSCSSCMADVYGPYLENENQIIQTVEAVRVTESNPAVIVCRYVCYDDERYNFELTIDILDPQYQRRELIQGSQEYQDHTHDFRVIPLTNSFQTCDQRNNETIRKYRIHVGSSVVPTLIAKCFVIHSPNSPSSIGSSRCSNSSTLAIIPGYSTPESSTMSCSVPSKTISLSPSSCMPSTVNHKTVTVTVNITVTPEPIPGATSNELSRNCTDSTCSLKHQIYGPILAALTATIVLLLNIIVMVYLCAKLLGK